ncbi:hypothetical protein ACIQW5_28600 [Methylorubrum thiocyanatum]|uniref:hypothetical protein n=1 Tax=Methylorubrum thiocyanatum TaxID=47958 RepID=UPI0035C84A88
MSRRAIETACVASFAISQYVRPVADLDPCQPSLQEIWCDVEEDPLPVLFDRRQPLDGTREIRTVDGELDFVEFALSVGRRRLKTSEAVEVSAVSTPETD